MPIDIVTRVRAEKERRRRQREQRSHAPSVSSLLDFTLKTNPRYRPSWFHRVICEVCDRVIRGELRRVIIAIPPRHGKTELISKRLSAYLLGLNPNAQIIATSYASDLASKNNRAVQRIIDSPEYQVLFPKTTLAGRNARSSAQFNYLRNSDEFEIVGYRGSYRSAGVGGGITGMGFGGEMMESIYRFPVIGGIGIIDDYFKNRQEADSPTTRNGVWEWYTSTFRTRCEDDAPIVVIATQWHEDGLIGRLIATMKADPDADQWEVIKLPAIALSGLHPLDTRSPGEALWKEKYPLAELLKIKASVGKRNWEALYQQNPSPSGGNLFKMRDWGLYVDLPPNISQTILSVDASFKGNSDSDFVVVGAIAQQYGKIELDDGTILSNCHYFIPYRWRGQTGITGTESAIREMSARFPWARTKLIEDKANGPAIIERLTGQLSGITPYNPGSDSKVARAAAIQPIQETGRLLLPLEGWAADEVRRMGRKTITVGEWWKLHPPPHDRNAEHIPVPEWARELIDEASVFPNGADDDQVDMFTQALNWMEPQVQLEHYDDSLTSTMEIEPHAILDEL